MQNNSNKKVNKGKKNEPLPGNPEYPASEDIYSNGKKETIEGDALPGKHKKKPVLSLNENLDVPGAELDDADEMIGEEDEENNYYSLGGESHNGLEEDKGE